MARRPPPRPATPPGRRQPGQGNAQAQRPNPVVARVDGAELRRSDIEAALSQLPGELRAAPPQMLFPLVLDQLIAQQALVNAARAQGLDKDPEVQAAIRRAEEEQLQQALLRRAIAPALTPEALRARYDREIAGKPGEEEVHARHILTATEAEARAALEEVRRPGADFAEVARRRSTGPGTQQGGDLGFFKKGDMVPEFAEAAFALQPGQISQAPVRSAFGWHIIKVEERRTAPVPSFEESAEELRKAAFEEAVNAAVESTVAAARVERFNMDGSPQAPAAQNGAPGGQGGGQAPSLLDGAAPPQRR
ncbi:peptidylprolyl isomerase [Pseudoroseomonas cervicalis]|uniref:peptidylprolyl isomerase n=1 Tax=Teichococcus cervicalis TaxID=204525 RepID=UPI0035E5523B